MQVADPPALQAPPSGRRLKWALGIGLILAGIGGLGAWAIASPDALSYYRTPSEIAAAAPDPQTRVKVGGRIVDGSLVRDGSNVRFLVTDGAHEVEVHYSGEVPDTLQEATDAIAEGRIGRDGVLVADRVLAKCSSKYVAEDHPATTG
ncbi:MAG TPA: cytochrome c maturation protein CcmE [Actinomycetota bacterium]|nr:cytochrome c maturation protein CcmE [Actinomycetota bacterium]